MIKHNFLLAIRYIKSKRIYASVILLSLVTGFVCANLMISFLIGEVTADQHQVNASRIYQVFSDDPFDKGGRIAFIPDFFKDYLVNSYPEIEGACQISDTQGITLTNEKVSIQKSSIVAADSAIFNFFDFPGIIPESSFGKMNIVISKQKALALLGTQDAVGKVISLKSDTTIQLIVSGVFEKSDARSHLNIDAIIHETMLSAISKSSRRFQKGGAFYIFVSNSAGAAKLVDKINHDVKRPTLTGPGAAHYHIEPLKNSYFNPSNKFAFFKTRTTGFITVGYVVCGLVLFIAMFNFINLFLLSWQSRRKDVGIKKTMGMGMIGLLSFSIMETVIYVSASYFISIIATYSLIPIFNTVFDATLSSQYFLNCKVAAALAAMVLVLGITAVFIAVLQQSKMKPIGLMSRGNYQLNFSRILFTLQFVIASVLAVCSVVIIKQMEHVQRGSLGFNRNIIQLEVLGNDTATRLQGLKHNLSLIPGIQKVCLSNGNPISGNMSALYTLENGQTYVPYFFSGDDDFVRTLGLKLISGKVPANDTHDKLVNETLVKELNLSNPIGQKVPGTSDEVIVGVVKDFTVGSFKKTIPMVIISITESARGLLVDFTGQSASAVLPAIEKEWKGIFSDVVFDYRIVQDDLMASYKEDTQFFKIVVALSVICIVLSAFGMFALSWTVIQSRTKEIGIRKVLGATPADVLNLLTITFTRRIIVAFILGAPLAYFLANQWLSRFVNRIELDVWMFVVPAIGVMMVSFMTLGFQTVKATRTNPVDEIRNN